MKRIVLAALALSIVSSVALRSASAETDQEAMKSSEDFTPKQITESNADVISGPSGEAGVSVTCAGVYSRCVAYIPGEDHMAVVNAQSSSHCWTLANRCSSKVSRTTYFGGQVRVVCAPLQLCSAR